MRSEGEQVNFLREVAGNELQRVGPSATIASERGSPEVGMKEGEA